MTPARRAGSSSQVVTFDTLRTQYAKGVPITMLTAHDFPTARALALAATRSREGDAEPPDLRNRGIDICLCGDSLAMVALGYENTAQLPLEEYTYHLGAVRRGLDSVRRPPYGHRGPYAYKMPLLLADLPFGTFEASIQQGFQTAISLIRAAHPEGVKIEGGKEVAPLVSTLTEHGVAVVGHVGLTPQRQASLSGYRVQGRTVGTALKILDDAIALQAAGAVAIVLEATPSPVAAYVARCLKIPIIGIGAGPSVGGQVLVQADMLGMLDGRKARFAKTWSDVLATSTTAIDEYANEVRSASYPEGKHGYSMDEEAWKELVADHGWS